MSRKVTRGQRHAYSRLWPVSSLGPPPLRCPGPNMAWPTDTVHSGPRLSQSPNHAVLSLVPLVDIMLVRFHTKTRRPWGNTWKRLWVLGLGLSKDACELDSSEKVTQLLCASIFLTVQCPGGSLQAGTTPSLVCIPTGSKDPVQAKK